MSSLLTIANDIFRETGFPDVSSVVGSSNQAARALLAEAQAQGRSMSRMRWSILTKRAVISTVSSAEHYSLPSDFYAFVPDTHWNTSQQDPMIGPVSDERWQANKSGVVTTTIDDRFQIRADGNENRLFIDPIPTSAEQISFFYLSDAWCRSQAGSRQNQWKADDDVLLLDELVYGLGVKWRFLRAQQREFIDQKVEYNRELSKAIAQDGGMKTLRVNSLGDERTPPFIANVGETGFGS